MEGVNLCFAYPNKFSYSETFIRDQIRELSPSLTIHEGWHPSILENGKSFLPFPLKLLAVRGALRNLLPAQYHNLYSHQMASLLEKNSIEVVLAQYGPMGAGLMDACRQANTGLVVHFHGFDAYHNETVSQYSDKYRQLFRQAKAFIAVSGDMKQQLIELGADADKVYINPCSVNIKKFEGATPHTAHPTFIAVGRFAVKKGPLNSIKAFAQVFSLCPEARLVMIGEGPLLDSAKELARELSIAGAVDFKGAQFPEQIIQNLRESKVFIQHSMRTPDGDSEGTPVSILEAAATGLPVVSTLHAGIKDAVIHGESGFLVEEGDVEGMAGFMYLLATDSRLAAQMGARGRRHMEDNYAMDKRINTLKQILREAAKA